MTDPTASSPDQVRVLLVDDEELIRSGIALILTSHPRITLCGEASSAQHALKEAVELRPDVIIMDIQMPGGSGIDAARHLLAAQPAVKILMLTTFDTDSYLLEALDVGVHGFLLKASQPGDLIDAVLGVADGGGRQLDGQVWQRLLALASQSAGDARPAPAPPGWDQLTPREQQVARLVSQGLTNAEIAHELQVLPSTIQTHVMNLRQRLGARNRAQVAAAVSKL